MRRKIVAAGAVLGLLGGYLALWPVPIEPVAWTAPPDPGYAGPFARNERLAGVEQLSLGEHRGPEDVAVDGAGNVYTGVDGGRILRLAAGASAPEVFADTGGRPLGMDFDPAGNLVVADGHRGLVSVSPAGVVTLLTDSVDGTPIVFADDVAVAANGVAYFSDASTRFGPKAWGGPHDASVVDIIEHSRTGRLLAYDPATRTTRVVAAGFCFANGVAVSPDQQFLLLNETGEYRTWRVWIAGPRAGQREPLIENLPGFPDNVTTGMDGRFWISLVGPRNSDLDGLAAHPAIRKVVLRLPEVVRPKEARYGHVVAVDASGKVVASLQDPGATIPSNTSAVETPTHLFIGSLMGPAIGRIDKAKLGL